MTIFLRGGCFAGGRRVRRSRWCGHIGVSEAAALGGGWPRSSTGSRWWKIVMRWLKEKRSFTNHIEIYSTGTADLLALLRDIRCALWIREHFRVVYTLDNWATTLESDRRGRWGIRDRLWIFRRARARQARSHLPSHGRWRGSRTVGLGGNIDVSIDPVPASTKV